MKKFEPLTDRMEGMPRSTGTSKERPKLELMSSTDWTDYELVDSGGGGKLERFGPYRIVRPEPQAVWKPALPQKEWDAAHLLFKGEDEEGTKGWQMLRATEPRWAMRYKNLKFWVQPTPFRHMGVFPEQAVQWDWIGRQIRASAKPVKVLNLFGYTGLSTLAAAAAGAAVTHVDASKKAIGWARENQTLSGLADKPVRWILDDAVKFVKRELRRGAQYDGMIMDPPKFGRGPKGEIWKLEDTLPALLENCRYLLSKQPVFVLMTVYASGISPVSLHNVLSEMLDGRDGSITAGEIALVERNAERILPTAVYAQWCSARH